MFNLIRTKIVTVKPTAKPAGAGWVNLKCLQSLLNN